MSVLSVLKSRPALFFRLSGICLADFDALVHQLQPLWLAQEKQRLIPKGAVSDSFVLSGIPLAALI